MAKYRVGQRARIVYAENPELFYLVGTEVVIVGVGEFYAENDKPYPYLLNLRGSRGEIVADDDSLEPIIDDGRTVVEWASMPFDPREVTA